MMQRARSECSRITASPMRNRRPTHARSARPGTPPGTIFGRSLRPSRPNSPIAPSVAISRHRNDQRRRAARAGGARAGSELDHCADHARRRRRCRRAPRHRGDNVRSKASSSGRVRRVQGRWGRGPPRADLRRCRPSAARRARAPRPPSTSPDSARAAARTSPWCSSEHPKCGGVHASASLRNGHNARWAAHWAAHRH